MIYCSEFKPTHFDSHLVIVSIYVKWSDLFLFLRKSCNQKNPFEWCTPGGKVENYEKPIDACVRELYEETGIKKLKEKCNFLGSLYIIKPGHQYKLFSYLIELPSLPEITLSYEHDMHKWISIEDIKKYSVILGTHETLEYYKDKIF